MVAGTSHHTAGFLEGWQETGPLNPHCALHPELGLPWFIQDCSSAVLHLEDGMCGVETSAALADSSFPANI